MLRRVSLLLTLVLLAPINKAQVAESQTSNQTTVHPLGWLNDWLRSTVSFGVIEKDQFEDDYFRVIGSGFLLVMDPHHGYIVTAKHVLYDPSKKNYHPSEIRVRYGWQEQESVYRQHGMPLRLRDASGKDLWFSLPDDSDIALIEAPPPIVANQPGMLPEIIAKPNEVFVGESIVAVGYPGIVGNEYLVRAICRGGLIAWLNPNHPIDAPFLIDANIYPGNSGGPVIRIPTGINADGSFALGGRMALLGIVVQAPGQEEEITLAVPGQQKPLKLHQQIPVGGTGVVEPAIKIRKLLDQVRSSRP